MAVWLGWSGGGGRGWCRALGSADDGWGNKGGRTLSKIRFRCCPTIPAPRTLRDWLPLHLPTTANPPFQEHQHPYAAATPPPQVRARWRC